MTKFRKTLIAAAVAVPAALAMQSAHACGAAVPMAAADLERQRPRRRVRDTTPTST